MVVNSFQNESYYNVKLILVDLAEVVNSFQNESYYNEKSYQWCI